MRDDLGSVKGNELGKPRQIRIPGNIERAIKQIADENSIDDVDVIRMALKHGVPAIRQRLAHVKDAA